MKAFGVRELVKSLAARRLRMSDPLSEVGQHLNSSPLGRSGLGAQGSVFAFAARGRSYK